MSTNDHRAGVREINLVNRTLKLNDLSPEITPHFQ
jgi:hypothetical protein